MNEQPPIESTPEDDPTALGTGHLRSEDHTAFAGAELPPAGHSRSETHRCRVGERFLFESVGPEIWVPPPGATFHPADQACDDTQEPVVGGDLPPANPTKVLSDPGRHSSGWLELRIWAEMLHDAQKTRIAASNRAERGGVDAGLYAGHIAMVEAAEHACALALRRCYRRVVPAEIIAWQKAERGIGEHLLARLLGHLGDPVAATPHAWMSEPPEDHSCDAARCGADRHLVALEPYRRSVSQLWSYCGRGDATRRRRVGMNADDAMALGSPNLKMLTHLLAEACIKQPSGNRYRNVYEAARQRYADRVDDAGKPWTKAHQHNAALRLVAKEILRDLWVVRDAASRRRIDTSTSSADGENERVAS